MHIAKTAFMRVMLARPQSWAKLFRAIQGSRIGAGLKVSFTHPQISDLNLSTILWPLSRPQAGFAGYKRQGLTGLDRYSRGTTHDPTSIGIQTAGNIQCQYRNTAMVQGSHPVRESLF